MQITENKKIILVRSHKADNPILLPSGDSYDSQATLIEKGETLLVILMNVDSGSLRKDKIEIANGTYKVICENHQRLGKCLRVLTLKGSGIIPTIQQNVNHKWKKIAEGILVHKGGLKSDNSAGCLTIHPKDWDRFINFWTVGENGLLEKI